MRRLVLVGWVLGCSVVPSSPDPSEDPDSPRASNVECFGVDVRCTDGKLTGRYGYGCFPYTGHCELGCRKDYLPGQVSSGDGHDLERVVELGQRLCEEYRLERGARLPGDTCGTDFDCLPFPPNAPRDGTAWPELMSCVGGVCREQAPETPADFGAPCTPTGPLGTADASSLHGIVVAGTCEHALCNIIDLVESDPGRCTMQCVDDAGCPPGWICGGVSIGRIVELYKIAGTQVCLDPCTWSECNAPTPDASTPDASTPDASTPDASTSQPPG